MAKHHTLILSLVSVLSSFAIMGLTIFFLVSDSSLSLISNPCVALEILSTVAVIAFVGKCMVVCLVDNSFFKEKPKTQILIALKSLLLLIIISLMYHCVAVLFGAPVFVSVSETFHFAILMTVLTALPLCIVAGLKPDKWMDVFTAERESGLETVVYLTTMCSLLGAWLGAVPIPLDWDRPWQNWPISCSVGGLSGYSIGLFLASIYLPHQYKASLKTKAV